MSDTSKKSRPATYELIAMLHALNDMVTDDPRCNVLIDLCIGAVLDRAEQYDYSTAPIGKLKDTPRAQIVGDSE